MASSPLITAVPAPEYEQIFRRTSGWIGADGDFSIPLPGNKVLWLYSDTFVGEVKDGKRINCTMINNSAAIQILGHDPSVNFYYKTNKDGAPASLITPDDGKGYFWLFHGVLTKTGLYLFLMNIEHVDNGTAFPFRSTGTTLGHVSNPQDTPDKWKISQRKLDFCTFDEKSSLYFGSAVLKHDGYAYIYGLDSTAKDPDGKRRNSMVLARVKEDQFGDLGKWRFLCGGKWMKKPVNCDSLCDSTPTEYSISYIPSLKQFAFIYTEGGIFGRIQLRLSPKPEGPWGEPISVYECPDRKWHEKTYSYASKAHPELSESPDELIVTYATNSMHFPDLFEDARLYWPRFIKVKLSNTEKAQ